MNRVKYIVFVILLASCTTFDQLEVGLQSLMGKHVQTAFSVLGHPNTKQNFIGDDVYTWYLSQSGSIAIPQTSTTTGYVGNTPIYGSTTYMQQIPINYSCTIKLVTNSEGILNSWEYNGNIGGCMKYINRLKEYTENHQTNFLPSSQFLCQVDADCPQNKSCRSTSGGGTQCR